MPAVRAPPDAAPEGEEEVKEATDEEMSVMHASARPGYALQYHLGYHVGRALALARPAKPPPFGCFTVPRWQPLPALEALLGLLFANLFWVGLWDLLDNTIFPHESSVQMLSLVVGGALMLFFTNSLYEPPLSAVQRVMTSAQADYDVDETPLLRPIFVDDPALKIRDQPFRPPRFEIRRLLERVLANTGAVCIWTGLWDQIDVNILPNICSYEACGNCTAYGTFPCAWYKIMFMLIGLVGLFFTRNLYNDREVSYAPRGEELSCECCGWRADGSPKDK